VRPLELRLAGFRSYRTERTVSFQDLDIVAIIGDTGAGKSSLLEAMTWALYGASTWSKKSSTELLAHGAKRMSVALEFEAAGERWRVTRTFARSGGGGAELECLSNSGIAKVDGIRQVDPRIEEVLGLSYDVFCSCVLLPQGKFERLLKATPGERTDTLKSILRLEQLEEARALAERHAGLVAERERELMGARMQFLADPVGDVAKADAHVAALKPEHTKLETLTEQVQQLVESCRGYEARAKEATAEGDRLAARRGARAAALRTLEQRADELEKQLEAARTTSRGATEGLSELQAAWEAACKDGVDTASLTRHEASVTAIRATLKRRAAADLRIAAEEKELVVARATLDGARKALAEAERALTGHDDSLRAAATAAKAAEAALREAESAASELAGAVLHEQGAKVELASARATVTEQAARRADVEARLEAATADRGRAVRERDVAAREQAAAHVAANCAPGDPCPVCQRALPPDFAAHPAPSLDAATAAFDTADHAVTTVAAEERAAAIELRAATDRSVTAEATFAAAVAAREAAQVQASALPGVAGSSDPLTAAHAAASQAGEAAARAAARVEEVSAERVTRDSARLEHRDAAARAETAVEARERGVGERREEFTVIGSELEELARALPGYCVVDPVAVELVAVDAAEFAIASRLEAARELERQRETAREAATNATAQIAQTQLALQKEVATPVAGARAELIALRHELPEVAHEDLDEPASAAGPSELAAFAEAVEARLDAHVAGLRESVANAVAARKRDEDNGRHLVNDAGFEDSRALAARFDNVRASVLAAAKERQNAASQVEDAARLDDLLARAREMRAGFEALKDALADRAFVGFVVARRQRALLVHASKVLDEITGRYAFTDDFRILDRDSGLPRSPETLSGGETFIASLALALGLVEVADRSGGDLRALFLDEGFGTLDPAILETAISALEERAKAGRLIGVISHVPTVAERIDTVLEVRHGVGGSTIDILSAAEREQRVLDGAAAAAAAA